MAYTKVYSSLVHSTIWRAPDHIRLVWITMLALADRNGVVEASVPGLADIARVTLDQCVEALEHLQSPDPWSRSKEHEGRRIEQVEGGWLLLNHQKYRELRDTDERRAYQAEWVRNRRRQTSTDVDSGSRRKSTSTNVDPSSTSTSTSTRRDPPVVPPSGDPKPTRRPRRSKRPPTVKRLITDDWTPNEAHRSEAHALGLDCDDESNKFRDYCLATPKRYADFDAAFRNWLRRAAEYGRSNRSPPPSRPDARIRQVLDQAAEAEAEEAQQGRLLP